jgi:hypothetical protein
MCDKGAPRKLWSGRCSRAGRYRAVRARSRSRRVWGGVLEEVEEEEDDDAVEVEEEAVEDEVLVGGLFDSKRICRCGLRSRVARVRTCRRVRKRCGNDMTERGWKNLSYTWRKSICRG